MRTAGPCFTMRRPHYGMTRASVTPSSGRSRQLRDGSPKASRPKRSGSRTLECSRAPAPPRLRAIGTQLPRSPIQTRSRTAEFRASTTRESKGPNSPVSLRRPNDLKAPEPLPSVRRLKGSASSSDLAVAARGRLVARADGVVEPVQVDRLGQVVEEPGLAALRAGLLRRRSRSWRCRACLDWP